MPKSPKMGPVYLNGRFLSQPVTGVQRVASELIDALDTLIGESDGGARIELLVPRNAAKTLALSNIEVRSVGRLSGYAWEQTELPWYARQGQLISFCNLGPLLHPRQIVMIHDTQVFAMPENFSKSFVLFYRLVLPLLGRRARSVLTVSEFSRKQLSHFNVAHDNKIRVVMNGADHVLRATSDKTVLGQFGLEANRYVLAVGTDKRSKNFTLLRDSAAQLRQRGLRLAIAGGSNATVFGQSGTSSAAESDIAYCTELNDSRLRALYENAFCLAIPSLYEGFGLPAAEAMFCGCPVIASPLASLPEICGDAALYCDPHDKDTLLRQVDLLMRDGHRRRDMIDRGKARVEQLTWRHSAERLLDCLEAV